MRCLVVAIAVGLATSSVTTRIGAAVASTAVDHVGIYCMLEQVVVEPTSPSGSSGAAPQRIQLWGAFMFAGAHDDTYGPATRGYMYFACPPGKSAACKSEWADFTWYGGTGKGIGFGTRGQALGRLRRETDPVTSPDPYPLEGGIVKMESKEPGFAELVARLKAALGK